MGALRVKGTTSHVDKTPSHTPQKTPSLISQKQTKTRIYPLCPLFEVLFRAVFEGEANHFS